jgi:transposase
MLKLTQSQREVLEEAHRAERNKRHADRIKTVLALDDGFSHKDIADILRLDDSTTRTYEAEYLTGGLDEMLADHHEGGSARLAAEERRTLASHLSEVVYHSAKEICAYIKDTYAHTYTPEGLVPMLHRLGFVYKKTKQIPGKADPKKQKDFIALYRRLKKKIKRSNAVLYFLDGTHPQHNAVAAYGWIKKGTDKELRTNTGRTRVNLNGALNAEDHSVVVEEEETIDKHAAIRLFQALEAKHPTAETIYCIMDNARYYHAKDVREYEKNSRITMVFLPSYAPNLNLIERLWKFFHTSVLYNRYYEKRTDFQAAIHSFFKDVNDRKYAAELRSLLTENFQIIGDTS